MQGEINHNVAQKGMSLSPDHPSDDAESLFQRGLVFHKQNDLTNALLHYQRVLELEPRHAGALHFLGVIALTRKDHAAAISYFEQALAICDSKPVYWNNYGVALKETQRYAEAKTAFEKAIALNPNYADAWSNLAIVSNLLQESFSIVEKYSQAALRLQPDHIELLRHLGELYIKEKQIFKAATIFKQLVATFPQNAEYQHRLACLYGDCGEIEDAKKHFRAAVTCPKGHHVWRWKHLWYCPTFFECEEDINDYWHQLHSDLDEAIAENNTYDWRTLAYESFTHSFNLPHFKRCCRDVLEKFARIFSPSFPFERPIYKPGKRIRVGFLVTSGHEGGFLRYCVPLLERFNHDSFEVILIYHRNAKVRMETGFHNCRIQHFVFDWNFEKTVKTVRELRCDIMYYWKVGADKWNFFLPMCRLAPIQFTSWFTHGTSGLEHIDYYLTWDKAEVPHAQEHYTEQLFRINTNPNFEPKILPPKPYSRTQLHLPESGAIYFCPHRLAKYQPIFDDYFKQILERDTKGHLLLLLGEPSPLTKRFQDRMRKNIGEKIYQRILFLENQPPVQYYRYLANATTVLDSPIYACGISGFDALSFGVPCVTQTGELLVHRYTSVLYDEMSIPELKTSSKEEYVEQAVKLGADEEYRKNISQRILDNNHRVFEDENVPREWERFMQQTVETAF
jgi:Predicted O-linked N-acetylglucosamine transferase, SPINDLY family